MSTSEVHAASCQGKSAFLTWSQATKRAGRINRRKSVDVHIEPYRCGFCSKWHLGSVDPSEVKVNKQKRREWSEEYINRGG